MKTTPRGRGDALALLLLVAVWALVVLLVGLGGDYPLNDDWAYAYSARHLLQTGQLRLLDWGAPSLATHALWGAGALWLLGDSYVSLRCGTLVFGLIALALMYALARRSGFAPRIALLLTLCLGLSPWFLNLAFTYMTDVPWLAMVLASLLSFSSAFPQTPGRPTRPLLLLLAGALLGAAALTRQIAIIPVPAFAIVLAVDARRRGGRWIAASVRDCAFFSLPVVLLFGPFHLWYTRVHGPTLANRQTLSHILQVRPWHLLIHGLSTMHYVGLWLFPLALGLLLRRRLAEVVTRRQARVALALAGGYAVVMPLVHLLGLERMTQPESTIHPQMPFLGNVFYLIGLGPPTIDDVYRGLAPVPHEGAWLGVLLTIASTFGAVVGAGLFATTLSRARASLTNREAPPPEARRASLLRLLLFLVGGCYLLWILCTVPYVYDRYLLPLLPLVLILGAEAMPPGALSLPVLGSCLVVSGLFSVGGTHEYLSWNRARNEAVRALSARGIPDTEIDGGFEVNGPRHFESFVRRTGELRGNQGGFWVENAAYRISFWPSRTPACSTEETYPYWTWPGGGQRFMYVLHCAKPGSVQ